MLTNIQCVRKFLLTLAAALPLSLGANMAAAQSLPILVQAEVMTLVAPMTAGYDLAAMGGRIISPTSGTSTSSPVESAHVQVSVPVSGTYYLWARIWGPTISSDALYIGIDGSFDRVFPTRSGPATYEWIRVETSNSSGAHGFSLGAGDHTIQVGYGEIGAQLDAVYLTADSAEVPSFATPPMRLLIEAEAMNHVSPMTVGTEAAALSEQYLSPTSGSNTTNPVRSAHVQVSVPAGTWYLWARLGGPAIASDALYVGIDASFARTFPSPSAPYQWVRVATTDGSTVYGFSLGAGTHTIQVGHGEIGARLDAVYLTDDANEVPSFAPMRRVIEAESFTLEPPMMVGTDAAASGAQYVSPTSGTNTTVPVREASTTVTAPVAGTYYLWARLKGASIDSDALYVGFDNSWFRVFPSTTGIYEWVRVEAVAGSVEGFTLSAGSHIIQVGHGEIGARLDAVYVTDDASDSPTGSIGAPLGPCALPSGGYEGFGRNTTGGAGQPIYRVTNLNDSGAGSLRDALSVGDRCVVFDVGGTINLGSNLSIRGDNMTIDGLTAPAPGITLKNRTLNISSRNNVIVRGIRIRDHVNTVEATDNIVVLRSTNIVISQCSVSGFGDGAIDIVESSSDITVQWTIFGPGRKPDHNFFSLIRSETRRITFHHNLMIDGNNRYPRSNWIPGQTTPAPEIVTDLRNNLMWNMKTPGSGTQITDGGKVNVINNYYDAPDMADNNIIQIGSGGQGFTSGNVSRQGRNLNDNGNVSTAFAVPSANTPTTTDANTAGNDVKAKAGARSTNFNLDATDQGFIDRIPTL